MKLVNIRAVFAVIAAVTTCIIAPSAFAAILGSNDFESSYADFVADIGGEDASAITAYDSNYPSTTAPYPFSGSNAEGFGSNYLKVDTGDATLYRTFGTRTADTYLDTFMQFEPTSGEISYTNVAKIVVYLDAATSNLCVISGTAADDRTPVTNRLTSAGLVEPGTWGRLTIKCLSGSVFSFQVLLNGAVLSTAGNVDTFYCLQSGTTVSRLGIKGSGALDDFVARTTDPYGTAATIDGETYGSLAQAGAEAVSGKTILLGTATSEDITLSAAGVVFNTNGKSYTGHVSAASGLGWSEENGVYTASANTAATWTDATGDHAWSNADNWSSHGVPTAATTVTLPDGATIEATGKAALPVDSLIVNGAVKLTCTGDLSNNWPSIGIKGSISGSGTLTLERFGLTSSEGDEVTVSCNIYFDGKTSDSFLQSGSFVLNGSVTGTKKFQLLADTTFNGAVTLPDGAILSVGRSGTAATATFGEGSSLSGTGTVALWSNGYHAKDYAGFASIKTKLKDSTWTGVCELFGTITLIPDFSWRLESVGLSAETAR